MNKYYFAHSKNDAGLRHRAADHLSSVSRLAREFLAGWRGEEEAALAGLLHDIGKYGDLFQRRLQGLERGLDHWSLGAWIALNEYESVAAALAIEGHHIGLQRLSSSSLKALNPKKLAVQHPLNLSLTEASSDTLRKRMESDGLLPFKPTKSACNPCLPVRIDNMLDIRMLFSALVDADFVDTEAHFLGDEQGKRYRPTGAGLRAEEALSILKKRINELRHKSISAASIQQVRDRLLDACLRSAEHGPGTFTLTAPTGSGKTLAMLAFALAHAKANDMRRIVMVIPYLSIIEQTAEIYRELFEPHFGSLYILEHHSLSSRVEGSEQDIELERRRRLVAENWDAPLIITTSVQLLESLFANRPSRCRKLHRLRHSVILFDEVQTLPAPLALPTLAALSHLSREHHCSVLFSTATQPAFDHLHSEITEWLNYTDSGWQPRKVVEHPEQLFQPLKRAEFCWYLPDKRWSWQKLAESLSANRQALCIVNLKRHAKAIWELLKEGMDGAFHLSTNLCPAHRQRLLAEVRRRLQMGEPCRLISTQCIEAGVDVDFPLVYRAYGPLEAIIQAAGRCNREGRLEKGKVNIFMPEDEFYPGDVYQQAANMTKKLLHEHGVGGMDLNDPNFITRYYQSLYDLTEAHRGTQSDSLYDSMRNGSFVDMASQYRLIKQDSINVLVPYAEELGLYRQLVDMAEQEGLKREWIVKARPLCISLWRPKSDDAIWNWLTEVPLHGRSKERQEEWFIYLNEGHYHPALGLLPPESLDLLVA
jgi:CRISPR-associated endonuclease/helicase Cas3